MLAAALHTPHSTVYCTFCGNVKQLGLISLACSSLLECMSVCREGASEGEREGVQKVAAGFEMNLNELLFTTVLKCVFLL